MLRTLLIVLLLLPSIGRADEISTLERQRTLVEGHRARLEGLLAEQSKRIARLKAQPNGIQRDYQLGAALRENQALATRLTRLHGQVRELTQKLLQLHDQTLKHASLGRADRDRIQRRRAELAAALATGPTRIATGGKTSALDTPEVLEEKADLLQDSEEKVRRQLRQVQAKLAHLGQRARLERHAKAVDDNPFVEDSPRRSGGARKVTTAAPAAAGKQQATDRSSAEVPGPAAKSNSPSEDADSFAGAAPPPSPSAPAAVAGGGVAPAAPAEPRGTSETIISIREVLDPTLLRDPAGIESGESLRARIAALKKASDRLRQVAGKLSTQATDLRRRAKTLRTQH